MKRILVVAVLIWWVSHVAAQSGYRFHNYTIRDGLSQSSVTCVIQDRQNALWIGTQDGLNRFDGRSFEVFVADETPGLESSYITCSAIDKKGDIWFGTNNGLTKYDIREERFVTFFPNKSHVLQIENLAIDDEGAIWIASSESGLYRFDAQKGHFSNFSNTLQVKRLNNVHLLNGNQLLLYSENDGLFLFHTKTGTWRSIPLLTERKELININSFYTDDEGQLLVSTNSGVYRLFPESGVLRPFFPKLTERYGSQNINAVVKYGNDLWFIASNGNGLFTRISDGSIEHHTEDIFQKHALQFNEINLIYKDHSGLIWLGTQRGLSSFNPLNKGFLGVGPSGNTEKGLPTASVWSFTESPSERYLFVGTDKGVSRLDKESGLFSQYHRNGNNRKDVKGETSVLSILPISDYRLLVGCADGLFELLIGQNEYTFKPVRLKSDGSSSLHNRVYGIVHYRDSRYFCATKDGALLYDASNGRTERFEHDPKDISNTISKGICRMVYKDKNGRIWFATSTGGLNILSDYKGKIQIRPYEYNSFIRRVSKDYITSMYQDHSGNFWLGTFGSGLLFWNEKTKEGRIYSKAQGLPNEVIYGILPDQGGKLWLSTNKGIAAFDLKTRSSKNYTETDGLLSNEFNLGAYMKSGDGHLYFGGIYGYNFFKPELLHAEEKDIALIFSGFKLEKEWLSVISEGSPLKLPVFETKELNLNYRQRSFTLRFQPSDLSNPEQLQYKYKLEGSDEDEIMIGNVNEIHFNSLSSGSYVLKVYARLGEGPWSKRPAVMQIHIAYPFWKTWWFLSILAILVAISVRIFVRKRMDSAHREQIRLEIKVRERTKEIQKQNEKIEAQRKKIEEERNKVMEQQRLLEIEKEKTERLLKNVIPESTAEELKKKGRASARAYKMVSVLFTDFVGFTRISDKMNPSDLVKKLDIYFTKFDEIIVRNNLEKIKTIGDAYMCAGGVPVRNKTNPIDTCLAALQIQAYMVENCKESQSIGEECWELRLGINTGEVTAGVIGSERLAFDIWGSTVNQAQRMEMLGEPGKVTITGNTFQYIEPYFTCNFKGKAQSKSRGLIDMYVVDSIKPELSIDGKGIYPNERFQEIVNLHLYSSINYYKAERHIIKLLEQHLARELHYHSIAHTQDVVRAVERIALLEGVTDEGLFLLKSAATYHDAGFIEQYDANEPIGARLADEILPKYGYTNEHIAKIKDLIYVTKIPHQPQDLLEQIMCDADLDYLGRDDFHQIADKLRLELKEHGKINSDKQWDEIQVSFLSSHRYFTKTAKETRDLKKQENLQEVIERLQRDEYID